MHSENLTHMYVLLNTFPQLRPHIAQPPRFNLILGTTGTQGGRSVIGKYYRKNAVNAFEFERQ